MGSYGAFGWQQILRGLWVRSELEKGWVLTGGPKNLT